MNLKRLLLLLPLLAFLAPPAKAQNPGTFMPSCRQGATLTASGRATAINNVTPTGSVNEHCAAWTLSYASIGFSAISIEVDSASDASTGTPTTPIGTTPGSWTIWPAAQVAAGQSLPLTSTTGAAVTIFGFFPWVSVNLVTATCPAATNCQLVYFLYGWQVQGSQESNTGATQTQGVAANGANASGNPVLIAGTDGAGTPVTRTLQTSSAATLTATNPGINALPITTLTTWNVNSQPAVSVLASASQAAGAAGVRHVATSACFSAGSTTAPAATQLSVNLRDGASGAGTVKASWVVIVLAATGQNAAPVCFPIHILGTAATAMTLEFSSLLTNLFEQAYIEGYDTR